MSKGSKRRVENFRKVQDNWPENLGPKKNIICIYDTNNDGNCQHCSKRGGCKNLGEPFEYRSKYPPGTPAHLTSRFDPNNE